MKYPLLMSLGLVVVLIGCSSHQTVVLDSWWDVDYAKQSCNGHSPCLPDPVQAVHQFEAELATQFAEQTACRNVTFIRFNGPKQSDKVSNKAVTKPYWDLSLNFTPGAALQAWQLLHSTSRSAVLQGEGTPSSIAKEVCAIVTGSGAKVAN